MNDEDAILSTGLEKYRLINRRDTGISQKTIIGKTTISFLVLYNYEIPILLALKQLPNEYYDSNY